MKTISSTCCLLAIIWGCGGGLAPEDIPDIDGVWTISESMDSENGFCQFIGTLDIAQTGEQFSAQFSRTSLCNTSGIPNSAAAQTGSVASGRVGRETVDFRIGDCDYRGVLASGLRPEQVTGSILCTQILITGSLVTSTGTWHADRVTE